MPGSLDVEDGGAFSWLADHARHRVEAGLRRRTTARAVDDELLDLASNDYLGLARDPRLAEAAAGAVRQWGAGSTGSRLVSGSTTLHAELESDIAAFIGHERALVFSSGYLANIGAIAALSGPRTLIVSDSDNHASLIDGCRLSRSRVVVVPHRDVEAVAGALRARDVEHALVITDSVFSVDGETAALAELAKVCRTHRAGLLVDEAHAVGVLGPEGRGLAAAADLAGRADVAVTMTLSKSLGAQGGAVVGSEAVISHLVDTARTFIFDTGLAPASAAAAQAGLRALRADPGLADRARAAAARLRQSALDAGFDAPVPEAAVVGLRVGAPKDAVAAAAAALATGVRVGCFRPPSVPDGISRLRVTARADLDEDDFQIAELAFKAARAATKSR